MKNTRIYPLRTSSTIWKIKLYSKHICNDMCKFAYLEENLSDRTSIMFIIENPQYKDGKCPYSMKLNTSSVQMKEFVKTNPKTIDGELLFYNSIVIPDTEITLCISFPLKDPKNIRISSDHSLGFSLSSLINKIKNVYNWIYQEEENTCSVKTFDVIEQCNCSYKYLENSENINKEEKCSICLENLDDINIKKTNCNHLFHKQCIYEWINNNKTTCPLCRENILECSNNCINGFLFRKYTGKIIPKDMRGILSRNSTDGIFQIYGYDFEDLFIDEMIYNKSTKMLYPKVFG